jgi:hypothetical protein
MNQYQSNQPIYVSISTNEHKDNLIALAAGFLFGFIVQFPQNVKMIASLKVL